MSELGLPDEENATTPRVHVWWLLAGLVGVGVGFAAIWSLLAWGIGTLNSGDARAGTDCTDMGIVELEEWFADDLTGQVTMLECEYLESQD